MEIPVSIGTICGGALNELFDREMERIAADILDLNTDADAVRTITIKVKIKPDDNRNFGAVGVFVSSTLGQPKGVASTMFFGRQDGRAVAIENVPAQKELFDVLGPRPVVDFMTGEVVNG